MAAHQQDAMPGLFPSLWHYRWLALAMVVIVTGLSGLGGYLTRDPASASATVALKSPAQNSVLSPGVVSDATTTRYIEQRAGFFTNDAVLGEVAAKNGPISISDLRKRITAKPVTGTNVIRVTADAPTADEAVTLANTVVAAYRTETSAGSAQLYKQALDELSASENSLRGSPGATRNDVVSQAAASALADIERRGAELRVDALTFGDGVDFVSDARVEDAVVPGWPLRALAVGLILGLALAAVSTWVLADRKRRITDANAPVSVLEAPLLGIVARAGRNGSTNGRSGGTATPHGLVPLPQYQLVGAALMRRSLPGVVAVISPPGSASRSEATLNVVLTVASEGGRVLLVDADPLEPLSTRLQAELSRSRDGEEVAKPWTISSDMNSVPSVRVRDDIEFKLLTPTAGPGVTTPFAARELADRIWDDHEKYDLVVIDVPSIEATPVAAALIRIATGILAIVPRGCDESAIVDIRRTAEIYSSPVVGYVYTGARGIG